MKRKTAVRVLILVLLLSVIAAGTALASWQGTTHPRYNSSASVYPNKVIKANDPGCNNHFAVYYNVSTLPTKTDADNWFSRQHIKRHGGLDGFWNYHNGYGPPYEVYLCVLNTWPFNASTVKIGN
ncbi:MAG: hypothetical protein OXL96_28735 [Candidatus Poribacteria bacterium]|nr:hypothetical protein [Candidatus Poribacteria bacterium]